MERVLSDVNWGEVCFRFSLCMENYNLIQIFTASKIIKYPFIDPTTLHGSENFDVIIPIHKLWQHKLWQWVGVVLNIYHKAASRYLDSAGTCSFLWLFSGAVAEDDGGEDVKENPFKPGGVLSNEAENLMECWRRGGGWAFSQPQVGRGYKDGLGLDIYIILF